ncbi:MAG: tRNA uracil 4-sulfurtransferase ThiI [Mycoplasma sp.]
MNLSNQIILLKFGELCLKGKNVNSFKRAAYNNLKYALKTYDCTFDKQFDYIIIKNFNESEIDSLTKDIRLIPGFSYFTFGYSVPCGMEEIKECCLQLSKKMIASSKHELSFKIETKRSNKNFSLNSDEINRELGSFIISNLNLKVNVHNPDLRLKIEIKKDIAIIYTSKISTVGGLPVGTSGKCLVLLSGGIDSPVASFELLKRGMHVDFLTFITPPHTSPEALQKVKDLISKITNQNKISSAKLFICNYSPIQHELYHLSNESYRITILRRSFMRIANLLCEKYGYDCIATGDALGQVASQTIESLSVINEASQKLVLRPLIGFDKNQIINIAKDIDTYTTSIKPFDDACSLFAPKNPITKPKLESAIALESEIDLLKSLETNIINNIEVLKYDQE